MSRLTSGSEEPDRPVGAPAPETRTGANLVPVAPGGPIELARELPGLLLHASREITFGFLLGYLSLAVHGTLQYPRYAPFFVGPWMDPSEPPEREEVAYWTKRVSRRLAYSSEVHLGTISAVLSDGALEPLWIHERLGDTDPKADPPRRIVVRARIPRVDLILNPEPGHALDLYAFAWEVRERFNRQLD